jgi:hypothetical protein
MRFGTSLTLLALLGATGPAWGQAALDDEGRPIPTTDPMASPTTLETSANKLEYGADIRLRRVFVPKGLLELFVERAADGASNTGIGFDLIRRRGHLELQLGFEFEHVQPGEGVWINSGDNVAAGDQADYILGPDRAGKSLGWFTIEFTFLNHAPITKHVAVRYGGGAGIGFITGGLQKYDVPCVGATNENPEPGCVPQGVTSPSGAQGVAPAGAPNDYDLPPVFPVVNAIIGVQIRPTPKSVVNIETGIRTLPFIGLSAGYFFN